jgi:two-component system, NarL family, response regulator
MSQIRVLCVDDHRLMREGIVRILGLEPDITVVAQASTGGEAVDGFIANRPDVTLMDLQLPGMTGVQAIDRIRQVSPDARIVVLTMYQGDEDIFRALEAGANGYLLKDTLPQELVHAIREVHAGRQLIPADIQAKLATRGNQPVLTARELQVLELLARGMRNKEVGRHLNISEDTVRAYTRSIFVKLNVHDRTAALSEALRRGLVHIN